MRRERKVSSTLLLAIQTAVSILRVSFVYLPFSSLLYEIQTSVSLDVKFENLGEHA